MAFSILVPGWQTLLAKFACIVRRDTDLAKEAARESRLAIIRGISKLRDPASFSYRTLRIVHRECIDSMMSQPWLAGADLIALKIRRKPRWLS